MEANKQRARKRILDLVKKLGRLRVALRAASTVPEKAPLLAAIKVANAELARQRLILRPDNRVHVGILFTYKVTHHDGSTRDIKITASFISQPGDRAIARKVRVTGEKLLHRIKTDYNALTEYSTSAKSLYKIINGEDNYYTLLPVNGKPYTTKYVVDPISNDPLVDYRHLLVDDQRAPDIDGYDSFTNEQYGCLVETIHQVYQRNAKAPDITREAIYQELIGGEPIEAEFVDFEYDETLPFGAVDDDETVEGDPADEELLQEHDEAEETPIGFCVGDIVRFFNNHKKFFSVTISFPNHEPIVCDRSDPIDDRATRVELYANNGHVYLKSPRTAPVFTEAESTHIVFAPEEEWRTRIRQTYGKPGRFLIEGVPISEIVYEMYSELGQLPSVTTTETDILTARYGPTEFVQTADYVARKELQQKLKVVFPLQAEFAEWTNQSFARLGIDMFETLHGKMALSVDSAYDRCLINTYYTRPLIGAVASAQLPANFTNCLDLRKCYLNICKEADDHVMPVFSALDNARPYVHVENDEELPSGEYLIAEFESDGITVQQQFLNKYAVEDLLCERFITPDHILLVREAGQGESATALSRFAHTIESEFGACKGLYASFIGGLGYRSKPKFSSALSTDRTIVNSSTQHRVREIKKVQAKTETPEGEEPVKDLRKTLFCMYSDKSEEEWAQCNPYFRYVLGQTLVRVLRLARRIKKLRPTARILSTRLDSIYYEIPDRDNLEEPAVFARDYEAMFGAPLDPLAKFEEKKNPFVYKHYVGENPQLAGQTEIDYNDFKYREMFKDNTLTSGLAGVGKSYEIAQLCVGKSCLLLAGTRDVRNQMYETVFHAKRASNDPTEFVAYTLSMYRYILEGLKGRKPRWDIVIFDEFSMNSSEDWALIFMLATKMPAHGYGGMEQIPPVNARTYDVLTLKSIQLVFPNRRVIEYDPEKARYGPDMYAGLREFLDTGKLPKFFLDRVVSVDVARDNTDDLNMAYRRDTRDAIIAHKNSIGIAPDRYIVIKSTKRYDRGEILTRDSIAMREIPAIHWRSHVCTTVHSAQGSTYKAPYTIYEAGTYSLQMMYVALSRARDISQITIAGDKARLAAKIYELEFNHEFKVTRPVKVTGSVYWGYHELSAVAYCGKTGRKDYNDRLDEHVADGRLPADATREVVALVNDNDKRLDRVETMWIHRLVRASETEDSLFYGFDVKNKLKRPKEVVAVEEVPALVNVIVPPPRPVDPLAEFNARLAPLKTKVKVEQATYVFQYRKKGVNKRITSANLDDIITKTAAWIRANVDKSF